MYKRFVIYALFFLPFNLFAETSVWKISSESSHLYLVGTVHVLASSDYPLPEEFNLAYDNAETVVFETDIGQLDSAEFQQEAILHLMYQDGSTLDTHLKPETVSKLQDYCERKGIPYQALLPFKPGMLLSTLTLIELQSMGINSTGVDKHFHDKAKADGKRDQWFESTDLQLSFIAELGAENPDKFVNYVLDEMQELKGMMGKLRSSWRSGNMEQMDSLFIEPMEEEYPGVYNLLLKDRNARWMPKIKTLLSSSPVEMILVGAAHLAGDHGILLQLEEAGFSVQKL